MYNAVRSDYKYLQKSMPFNWNNDSEFILVANAKDKYDEQVIIYPELHTNELGWVVYRFFCDLASF